MKPNTYKTHSPEETEALAKSLLPALSKYRILLLSGHLGSGKTTFVKGLAKAMGIKERVKSPTYIYVNRYYLLTTHYQLQTFLHVDLYRFPPDSPSSILATLGLEEFLHDKTCLIAIEWPERIKSDALKGLKIGFTKRKDVHEITVEF